MGDMLANIIKAQETAALPRRVCGGWWLVVGCVRRGALGPGAVRRAGGGAGVVACIAEGVGPLRSMSQGADYGDAEVGRPICSGVVMVA